MATHPSATRGDASPNALTVVGAPLRWLAGGPWRGFIAIFLLSSAIQCFFLTKVPLAYVVPHTRWEMEAIAVSLAETGQFADPYALPTGATAHLPPILPGILAAIYKLFGMGVAAGYAAWAFRIVCYSTMYAMLPWLAGQFGLGRPAGVLAGLAGALMARWPGHGEALTAIVMGLLLVAFLRRWGGTVTWRRSLWMGVAWGVAFHLQPALLPVLVGCVIFELWWRRGGQRWVQSVVLALGVVLACLPWACRNWATFGEVFFIRSNLGLELRMAHHDGAYAAMEVMDAKQEHRHPRIHEGEARLVQQMGEVEYMRQAGREAFTWIGAHPAECLRLTALRVVHFWCGPLHRPLMAAAVSALSALALVGAWRTLPRQTVPQRAVVLIPLATYPLIYYVVTYMFRYSIPVNWILLVLAGAAVWGFIGGHGHAATGPRAGNDS